MTQMNQPAIHLIATVGKKGCITFRMALWDAKSYDGFGFSIQNLRDQAARLGKAMDQGLDNQAMTSQTEGHVTNYTQVTFVSLDG